jgi:hypothetical protein
LSVVAFADVVLVTAGAADVMGGLAGPGDMAPFLALNTSNWFLLVFARVEFLHVDNEAVSEEGISVFWSQRRKILCRLSSGLGHVVEEV